ncbi:hypothetical protein MBLNU457_5131t1 [Dothideomycetes sp. NU457]
MSQRAWTRLLKLVLGSALLVYFVKITLDSSYELWDRTDDFTSTSFPATWDTEPRQSGLYDEDPKAIDITFRTTDAAVTTEVVVTSELRHYTYTRHPDTAKSLFLTMTRDASGWGHSNRRARSVADHIALIRDTSGLPLESISIAIQTGSPTEYQKYIDTLNKHPFAKIQVLLYQPADQANEPRDRHDGDFQPTRRKQMSLARNMLMLRALGSEEHIFWYDGDVIGSDDNIAAMMIEHSQNGLDSLTSNPSMLRERPLPIGLITARCENPGMNNYDLNAWALPAIKPADARTRPDVEEMELLRAGKLYMAASTESMIYVDHRTEYTADDEIFPLDSVGGTILYIKADLVRKGLNFPPYFVVGTSWDSPNGYDGIETEGLCYIARTIGYGCYSLGGTWHISHQH